MTAGFEFDCLEFFNSQQFFKFVCWDGHECCLFVTSLLEVRKVNLKWKLSQSHKLPLKSSRVQPSPPNRPIVGKYQNCYSIWWGRRKWKPYNFQKNIFPKISSHVVYTPLVVELPKKIKKARFESHEKKNSLFVKLWKK